MTSLQFSMKENIAGFKQQYFETLIQRIYIPGEDKPTPTGIKAERPEAASCSMKPLKLCATVQAGASKLENKLSDENRPI